jgi:hypothetical protein
VVAGLSSSTFRASLFFQVDFADGYKQSDGKVQYDEFFGAAPLFDHAARLRLKSEFSDAFFSASVLRSPGDHHNTLRQIYVLTRHGRAQLRSSLCRS